MNQVWIKFLIHTLLSPPQHLQPFCLDLFRTFRISILKGDFSTSLLISSFWFKLISQCFWRIFLPGHIEHHRLQMLNTSFCNQSCPHHSGVVMSQSPSIQPAVPPQNNGVTRWTPKTLGKGGNLKVPYQRQLITLLIIIRSITVGEKLM